LVNGTVVDTVDGHLSCTIYPIICRVYAPSQVVDKASVPSIRPGGAGLDPKESLKAFIPLVTSHIQGQCLGFNDGLKQVKLLLKKHPGVFYMQKTLDMLKRF